MVGEVRRYLNDPLSTDVETRRADPEGTGLTDGAWRSWRQRTEELVSVLRVEQRATLEGITLELTFRAATLVQAWINPHILIDAVQPNLLDLAGECQRDLQPIYTASGKLLPW